MDYFNEAFGGFEPHLDKDAAAKFAINALMMDDRVDRLVVLLRHGSSIGIIEGDPGWQLERRDRETPAFAYAQWPENAVYRAAVDPDAYALAHAEAYFEEAEFRGLIKSAVAAYLNRQPGKKAELLELCRSLEI